MHLLMQAPGLQSLSTKFLAKADWVPDHFCYVPRLGQGVRSHSRPQITYVEIKRVSLIGTFSTKCFVVEKYSCIEAELFCAANVWSSKHLSASLSLHSFCLFYLFRFGPRVGCSCG